MKYMLMLCYFLLHCHSLIAMYSTEAAVYSAESLIDPTELCMVGIITENYRLVKEGLARGADVNYNNFVDTPCNPLQKACLKNNIENIKLIINSPHIKINAYKGRTTAPAFHYAMYNDAYKTIVPLFLAHSQKAPNVQNAYGNTMLHIMCKIDHHEKVRYLLSFPHINPNKRNKYGDTPLHIAAAHSATDCIQLLLNHPKTKRLQRNEAGEIPFDKACFSGNIESVKLLLPLYSKRINIKDYHGYTPLHSACHQGSQEKVILLLENSASPTQQNNYQETPLATAFFRLDVNAFNNFYTYNPHYEQLLFNKDKHNNTQLHLAALIYDENILLDEYLVFLISQGLNTWARNDFNETATDIVCKKYNELYHAYKTQRANYLFKAMIKQEATMHSFLRVVSPKTECILFKQVLKHLKLCKDVQKKIAYLYYALNIETIIAQEYFNSKQYYEDFIENKNKIKTRLINNPRSPQLLWWPRYDEIH